MAKNCANYTKTDLLRLGIDTTGLSTELINAAITKAASELNITTDTVLKNKAILNDYITAEKIKKIEEDAKLAKANKVGNAFFVINGKVSKNEVKSNKNTLYVYPNNLQAHNALSEDKVEINGLITPSTGVKLNVSKTSAIMRTDSIGIPNPNVKGLVVKKNAQGENGEWIQEEGDFTETDREVFNAINGRIIDEIAEAVSGEDYKKLSFVPTIAFPTLDSAGKITKRANARLPKVLAEDLAKMLDEKLGITSQVLPHPDNPNAWGLVINPAPKPRSIYSNKKGESSKNSKTSKVLDKEAIEKGAKESLNAVRPISAKPSVMDTRSLLSKVFPNIAQRKARVDYISTMFSEMLTHEINAAIQDLEANENLTDDESFVLQGLKRGTETDRRRFALTWMKRGGKDLPQYIIERIGASMYHIIMAYNEGGQELASLVDVMTKAALGQDMNVRPEYEAIVWEFAIEMHEKGIPTGSISKMAVNRVAYLASTFSTIMGTPGVFEALWQAAAPTIEKSENVKILPSGKVTETMDDLAMIDEEGSVDDRSGLNLVKYKLVNPASTLSTRIRRLLSNQYKMAYSLKNGYQYVFDDLGQRVKMNPEAVFYKLLNQFAHMNRPEDFDRIVQETCNTYPWFIPVAEELDKNLDLRNEFFRAMKTFIPYVIVSPNGNITSKNQTVSAEALLDNVTKNYEGRIVLGQNSLYTETGETNMDNVNALNKLLSLKGVPKKTSINDPKVVREHPLAFAYRVLNPNNSKLYTLDNIRKALDILRGEYEGHGHVSLEAVLNNIGIDTTDMNLEALLPIIDDSLWEDINDNPSLLEGIFTPDQMRKIRSILDAVSKIVGNYGFNSNKHLVNDFKMQYITIGNAIGIASEGYTLSSFLGPDGNQRYSYGAMDYIAKMTGIISDTSTPESIGFATQWIEKNFGEFEDGQVYDWFKSKDGDGFRWNLDWLDNLQGPEGEEDSERTKAIRKNFVYKNVLQIANLMEVPFRDYQDGSIGRVDNKNFLAGLITSFFNGGSSGKLDLEYGYYRTPLPSDTPALVLIKHLAYRKPGYEKVILDKLLKVFEQEVDRIMASRGNNKDEIIEFYNDKKNNANHFNFLTHLRGREDEIISHLKTLQSTSNDVVYAREKEKYLRSILEERDEEGLNFLDRRVESVKAMFSDAEKEKLYRLILKAEQDSEKDDEENNEDKAEEVSVSDVVKETSEVSKEEQRKQRIAQVDEWIRQFYYNDYFAQSQIIQLVYGDLAYAKNIRDFVKRNKQSYASGERMYARNEDGSPMVERAMYMEDIKSVSNSWKEISNLLHSQPNLSDIELGIIEGSLKSYTDIKDTDGQSFRNPKSFIKIYKALGGMWTDDMEEAYNRMINGTVMLEDFITLFNPIKPFLFSFETRKVNGRNEKIPVQHKNSEYVLSAMFSLLNVAMNNSPELRALHQFMDDNDIDVVHFHSSVKVGYNNPFYLEFDDKHFNVFIQGGRWNGMDIKGNHGVWHIGDYTFEAQTYDKYKKELLKALTNGKISQQAFNAAMSEFKFKTAKSAYDSLTAQFKASGAPNMNMIHTFPMEDYMIMQPSADHLIDAVALFGSQLRNIIPADLPETFTMNVTIGGKTKVLNRDEAVEWYNTLIVDNLVDAFSSISNKFKDIRSIKKMLDAAIENNPKYGDDVKAALELNEEGTAFRMPFNSPNLANKIEDLILSVFKNSIQRQKINGGNSVLVSNFGLSDSLHVVYNDPNDSSKGVAYIEAYLPAYTRDMYADYLVEKTEKRADGSSFTYWTLDFEKLKRDNNEDILKIIGYRIPTEDKYSIMPIKIMGFMPVHAGTTIMLPSDIITMSGTDFDIDKLFLMIKALRRETFSPKLTKAFYDWLRNREGALDEASVLIDLAGIFDLDLSEETKKDVQYLKKKLRDYFGRGYTDEEINSLMEKSELFTEFMEDTGIDYSNPSPKYVPYSTIPVLDDDGEIDLNATSRMKSVRNRHDRKAIRDNMLIDTIWGVLTSPEGSRLMMTPASYDNLKHSSRQNMILRNYGALTAFMEVFKDRIAKSSIYDVLDSLSVDDIEKFMEEHASPDEPLDIAFYLDTHRNLMDGNDLIGMFAVNSSAHYKFQSDAENPLLTLNEANQFSVSIPGYNKGIPVQVVAVDPVYSPITGERVGRICSEFQAASPDNGKDPVLGDVGANTKTASRIGFLARIGLPCEVIGYINTADDVRQYGESIISRDQRNGSRKRRDGKHLDIRKLVEVMAKLRIDGTLNSEDSEVAAEFSIWMDNVDKCAKDLQSSSSFSRSDSRNGALAVTAAGAIQQILKVEDFILEAKQGDFAIQGLVDLINNEIDATQSSEEETRRRILNSKLPRLQAFYTYGIKSGLSLAGTNGRLNQITGNVIEGIRILRQYIKSALQYESDTKTIKQFINELTIYLMSNKSLFASDSNFSNMEKRNYYIHDFPMKFKAFLNAKDEDGEYIHKDVRELTLIKMLTNENQKGIKFRNVGGKVSPDSRKYFMEALEYMLSHRDADVVDMAIDLFMYSFYDNGFTFGHSNFGIFFTTSFMESIPDFVSGLVRANGQLLEGFDIQDFVEQFLLNHTNLIPEAKGYTILENGNIAVSNKPKRGSAYGPYTTVRNNKARPVEFVRIISKSFDSAGKTSKVFRLVLNQDGMPNMANPEYTEVKFNKHYESENVLYYDTSSSVGMIDYDALEDRGFVYSEKTPSKKAKKNSKDPKNSDKVSEALENQENVDGSTAPQDFEDKALEESKWVSSAEGPLLEIFENSANYDDYLRAVIADEVKKMKEVEEVKSLDKLEDTNNENLCIPLSN